MNRNTVVSFDSPNGLALDSAGDLYVCDVFNHRIRKMTRNWQ